LLALKSGVTLVVIDNIGISDMDSNIQTSSDDDRIKLSIDNYLYIDIYRIDQVIRNLISNAIKFTPANSQVTILFDS
jgi:signal transduction histidine kinase